MNYKARAEKATEERNRWIRAFNRLEKAVCRHEDATVEFRTENDEALHAAHKSVMRDLSTPAP